MDDDPYPNAVDFKELNLKIKHIVGISKMLTMCFAVFRGCSLCNI